MTLGVLLEEIAYEEDEAVASPICGSFICRWRCECRSIVVHLREEEDKT